MNKKKVFVMVTLSLIIIAIGALKYKTDYASKEINTYSLFFNGTITTSSE